MMEAVVERGEIISRDDIYGKSLLQQSPEWEHLRREIIDKAMLFTDRLSFDLRRMLTEGKNVEIAGRLMWQLIKPLKPEVLVGPGFGSTPLLFGISLAALADGVQLKILWVRDKRKEHNQKKWVEGNSDAVQGMRAVMVDDFMSAGSAYPLVQQALKADKVTIEIAALALFFDMWEPLGTRQLSVSKVSVLRLFSRHDVGLSRDCYDAKPPLMKGSEPDFVAEQPRWWRMALNTNLDYPTKCPPKISGNAVYVADEKSTLWKHDLATGDVVWSRKSLQEPAKAIVQQLQIVQNSLIYGCYDGSLTRTDAQTGEVMWRWKLDSSIHATPTIDEADARIFINTEQWNGGKPMGHMQCLELATGQLKWKYSHPWWPPGSTVYCDQSSIVVAPCNDESLVGLDANTGEVAWRFKTKGLVRGCSLLLNNRVFVATERGYLHCIDVSTGELYWEKRYGKGSFHQFLQADEASNCIFVVDGKWHFIAFDAETGSLRWINRLRSVGCWQPVRCGSYWVVLSRDGNLAVLDPIRELKVWEGSLRGRYHQPPDISIQNGVLVAASSNAGLLAFNIHPHYCQSYA